MLAAASALAQRQSIFVKNYGGINVPASGAYWGADDTDLEPAAGSYTGKQNIETASELNKRIGIHNRHYGVKTHVPTVYETKDAALTSPKVITMVSINGENDSGTAFPVFTNDGADGKQWDTGTWNGYKGLDRITHGEWDTYLDGIAHDLNALGVPVIFRLWMEMNGSHNPYMAQWQGGVGTGEAKFVAAWRHVWNRFNAQGATINNAGGHVIFVFCPQAFVDAGDWRNYWPGDSYVDWAGIDTYRNTFDDDVNSPGTGQDFLQFFTKCHNGSGFNHTTNKPLLVCEGGWQQGLIATAGDGFTYDKDGTGNGGTDRAYIFYMRSAIKSYPDVLGYVAWNNKSKTWNDYIDTSTTSLTLYSNWVRDTYFTTTR